MYDGYYLQGKFYTRNELNHLLEENDNLETQLQQKENIIKEVREYTSKTQMPEGYKKMILEILGRE